jgi:LysR family hydrogen peroxide-inducible transcriptional activator
MNLQQLDYIIAVDTYRHFGKAAEKCFVTQATLSAMIKKLEEELGIILFDRKSHPVITTDCGKEIIEHAKRIKMQVSLLHEKVDGINNVIKGDVRLGIIPTISSSLLPIISKEVFPNYPDLNITILENTTTEIIKELKSGDLDMAIVATPLLNEDIEEFILYYERFYIYNSKTELEKVKYITPENIRSQRVWLLEDGHCFRDQFVNLCNLKQFESFPENFKYEGSSFDSLINMTDTFGGLTLIPELYVHYLSKQKRKKLLDFKTPYPVREVSLITYRPNAKLRIINILKDNIAEKLRPQLTTSNLKNSELYIVDI